MMTYLIITQVLMAVSGLAGWFVGRKGLAGVKAELETIKAAFKHAPASAPVSVAPVAPAVS